MNAYEKANSNEDIHVHSKGELLMSSSSLSETRAKARRLENEIDSKLVQLSACSACSSAAAASSGKRVRPALFSTLVRR